MNAQKEFLGVTHSVLTIIAETWLIKNHSLIVKRLKKAALETMLSTYHVNNIDTSVHIV